MTVRLYMDHHVSRAITIGLRQRGVDILTAEEDGTSRLPDPGLLDRATDLGRVLFTQDRDLWREAHRRQAERLPVGGVVYAHQLRVSVVACVADLELIALASDPEELRNRVTFLPL